MRPFFAILIATLCVAALSAQDFEKASVTRSSQNAGADVAPPQQDPARVHYPGATLRSLLARAYGVALERVAGPKWIGDERFDIDATLPAGATPEQIPVMLQHLLAQRFGVIVHEENKTAKFFALVPAKGGVKMKSVEKPEISATVDLVSDSIQLRDYTMPQFA
ncbi:MAG TPA: TIGR03435 family protein, partial [Bryobacteraceae bacterium]